MKIRQITFSAVAVILVAALLVPTISTCKKKTGATDNNGNDTNNQPTYAKAPVFNSDSAYAYVKQQVDFGPRVTDTDGWRKTGDWLKQKLSSYADTVYVQKGTIESPQKKTLQIENYVASFNPKNPKRIIVCAHWDTRHVSDRDPNPANRDKPILGADDGASGVGVIIEIARLLKQNKIDLGVDLILFDAEDWGIPDVDDSYGLGSQYWSRKPHIPNYRAMYGILLDMVGGKNSTFARETFSLQYASDVVRKVWTAAGHIGYGNVFVYSPSGSIEDDHFYMNTTANIPTIDIIADDSRTESGFPAHWHTQADNMDIIDKNTLKAVGQTVLQVLYNEQTKPM